MELKSTSASMDDLRNRNDQGRIHCNLEYGNNERITEYLDLNNRRDDPLRQAEITVNLNEGLAVLPLHHLEVPEEDLFDYDTDGSLHEGGTDSEEQVVPSSQLSNSYKYLEDGLISDSELDEGIEDDSFEEYFPIENTEVAINNNNSHNPQPP